MALDTSAPNFPRHIAIIMDGNGRWAAKHMLPRAAGHRKGAEVFKMIMRYCESFGLGALTVYAFSTENWSRSADEVGFIMNLFKEYIFEALADEKSQTKVKFIGEKDRMSQEILELERELEEKTAHKGGMKLNIAVNYGGRADIVSAVRKAASMAAAGEIAADDIDEDLVGSLMYTSDSPPVDLIIRTSGEERISNFLLWQCAYSEFVFTDRLWPDFTKDDLDAAINEFCSRKRRFGGREK
ncbi:MAG: polyprenyl diphosphate synthase [Oscillospiraceae bacterium]|jgi:undecaprenyl diphosphate synthase